MRDSFFRQVELVTHSESIEDLIEVCRDFASESGFDHFIFGASLAPEGRTPFQFVLNGYPEEWRKRYVEKNYLYLDPTVMHSQFQMSPLNWNDIGQWENKPPAIQNFMNEAGDFGLRSGCTFPVHRNRGEFSLLSLSSGKDVSKAKEIIRESSPLAQLFSRYLYDRVCSLLQARNICPENTDLTDSEKQCLFSM